MRKGIEKMQYWTCEHCGSNLDYGEKCDCQAESYAIARKIAEKLHALSANTGIPVNALVASTVNLFVNENRPCATNTETART